MKMGEQIYKQEQEACAAAGGASDEGSTSEEGADEDVVEAEFSEVDEDNKKD